jgi:NAD(P)-dependent dehydrogenase (short-subunit alcohol dehydrogenase family)
MPGLCQDRIAIVTGAGRGIGRSHALELARQGATVVVNDLGAEVDGTGQHGGPADAVVDEIRAMGGTAIADNSDVSNWESARRLIDNAVDTFGGLDVLINNAGILRDRMLVNMTAEEWDAVMRVHLRGTFAPSHWAASYWRSRSKSEQPNDARIINTTSSSGIYGNVGQSNYGAAKAGIAAFTIIAAQELARYGVTVNALAPGARTRMTENLARWQSADAGPEPFDVRDAENIAPLAAWLASVESGLVTGRVFNVRGGFISVAEGWHSGPGADKGARWEATELGDVVPNLVREAAPNANTSGVIPWPESEAETAAD